MIMIIIIIIIIIICHGLNTRGRPTPASSSSASYFGPTLTGSLLADSLLLIADRQIGPRPVQNVKGQ